MYEITSKLDALGVKYTVVGLSRDGEVNGFIAYGVKAIMRYARAVSSGRIKARLHPVTISGIETQAISIGIKSFYKSHPVKDPAFKAFLDTVVVLACFTPEEFGAGHGTKRGHYGIESRRVVIACGTNSFGTINVPAETVLMHELRHAYDIQAGSTTTQEAPTGPSRSQQTKYLLSPLESRARVTEIAVEADALMARILKSTALMRKNGAWKKPFYRTQVLLIHEIMSGPQEMFDVLRRDYNTSLGTQAVYDMMADTSEDDLETDALVHGYRGMKRKLAEVHKDLVAKYKNVIPPIPKGR